MHDWVACGLLPCRTVENSRPFSLRAFLGPGVNDCSSRQRMKSGFFLKSGTKNTPACVTAAGEEKSGYSTERTSASRVVFCGQETAGRGNHRILRSNVTSRRRCPFHRLKARHRLCNRSFQYITPRASKPLCLFIILPALGLSATTIDIFNCPVSLLEAEAEIWGCFVSVSVSLAPLLCNIAAFLRTTQPLRGG